MDLLTYSADASSVVTLFGPAVTIVLSRSDFCDYFSGLWLKILCALYLSPSL